LQHERGNLNIQADVARQKTLNKSIHCRGIGLHSGARVNLALHPAAPGHGIVFRRSDLGGSEIAASWRNIVDSTLCTTLGDKNGLKIATVEHLMSALAGLEVDNVVIELDGPEVPVMDGSAAPFVFLIECAGLVEQHAPRRAIKVLKPVSVGGDGKSAALLPDDQFRVSFAIDFASDAIKRQELSFTLDAGDFKHEISRARTFGFLDEVDRMQAAGLARGGSLDNAIVISGGRVLNKEGLRYGDEFVRHKVLDALGDLYLAGGPILGHFHGVRSGHATNRTLIEALFADPTAWCAGMVPSEAWEEAPRLARA
jgi:UDP-3-O-[3-hydroxymyristoyl] N-acetylglucosamine deacetylase